MVVLIKKEIGGDVTRKTSLFLLAVVESFRASGLRIDSYDA
jgi:hypothetical protein